MARVVLVPYAIEKDWALAKSVVECHVNDRPLDGPAGSQRP